MQKLWQFWFPSGSTAGRSGSTAWVLQAVVPLVAPAVVPLRSRASTASNRGVFFVSGSTVLAAAVGAVVPLVCGSTALTTAVVPL